MSLRDELAAMLGLPAEDADVFDEVGHHLAFMIAAGAVQQSATSGAATFASAITLAASDTRGRPLSGDLLAIAIVQRLCQIVRTLAAGSESPLAANLAHHEQLADLLAAQLPDEVERYLARAVELDASAERLRDMLGGGQ